MDPFLGQIIMFGGNYAPRGWAFCDGQLLSVAQYSALFSILGTIYGGDGRSTFALPDLRGRVPMHAGNGPGLTGRRVGSKGGTEYNVLNELQMPSHSHLAQGSVKAFAGPADSRVPTNNYLAGDNSGDNIYHGASNSTLAADSVNVTVGHTGGNQPVNNIQPYQVVNYIIALQGLFPSRS